MSDRFHNLGQELVALRAESEVLRLANNCYRVTLRSVLKDIRDDIARGGMAESWHGVAETIAVVLEQGGQTTRAPETPKGLICTCGLPRSENPHPDAGKPGRYLEVGTQHECIPCTVKSRHEWAQRATKAESQLNELAKHGEQQEAVPEETPHIIVFDDADRQDEKFSGAGARQAALRRWQQISVSWNAHLFVRVERNSRDDPYPCARLASQVNRIPAGLYAELEAMRTLRDAAGVYLQGYMRDEIEDEESCSAEQHDAACSVKSALDNARALEWKGGGDA